MKVRMKVGDLIINTHALDRCGLGIIVEIDQKALDDWSAGYFVHWCNPPKGIAKQSWSSDRWLEKVDE